VKTFIREAHARDIRVITELPINHTSNEHPWFQRARRAPKGSNHRDFYVWSDTPERYQDARIIFQDFESSNWSWDPIAQQYYWHRFYAHQPDLNFQNPEVLRAVFEVLDYWMDLGVDGMRLDAIPYLYERDGTNCENLPETHAFLKKLRAHIDAHYKGRMLLAEANQWPEDSAAYFGTGDECHMNFHFPLMPRMFMALQLEDAYPVIDILEQTPKIPDNCQWAMFLRNHDELTLEMVTDEDRDYMYRMYARDPKARINLGIRRRLAPLLQSRDKIELMNGLLMSLPGTPVLYYGDEIGMGDNVYLGDRNGVRTPMQWSSDRNAGFSRANPQKLYFPVIIDPEYHYEAINVEAQQGNPSSLLWWMKRLISLRKQHSVFGRGTLEFLQHDNAKVLAFVRSYEGQHVVVVANLSRRTQCTWLNLSQFKGAVPVEMLGPTDFPQVGDAPYFLSLAPYAFHWFSIKFPEQEASENQALVTITVEGGFRQLFAWGENQRALERVLTYYVPRCRWFRSKARTVSKLTLQDVIKLSPEDSGPVIALLYVDFGDSASELYALPLAFAQGDAARAIYSDQPKLAVARLIVKVGNENIAGLLHDAMAAPELPTMLLDACANRSTVTGKHHFLRAERGKAFADARGAGELSSRLIGADQSNTSVVFGDRLVLKLLRKLEHGSNPDIELSKALTERASYSNTAAYAGSIEVKVDESEPCALVSVQAFAPNQGDAWHATLNAFDQFLNRVLTAPPAPELPAGTLFSLSSQSPPNEVREAIGAYLPSARLLGQRLAELHLLLANLGDDPAFKPEPFSRLYQRSMYESTRTSIARMLRLLRKRLPALDEQTRELGKQLLERKQGKTPVMTAILVDKIEATRIRVHGDLHLGQVLFTGKDFVFIDFEGEPGRSLGERRFKRSPLRDVTAMMRSFDYVASTALRQSNTRAEDLAHLTAWCSVWTSWVSAAFLGEYLAAVKGAHFIPKSTEQLEMLLAFYTLDKCVYELAYELNNRPDWAAIPARALIKLLDQ
jgi:maltose alpha-D-glucosyltransferase/alpha-amylase